MATPMSTPHPIVHPSAHLVQDLPCAVEAALSSNVPMRMSKPVLSVTAAEGVVTLAGNVRGGILKAVAERLAMAVPGVTGVIDNLATDTTIESAAAEALAADPSTRLVTDDLAIKSVIGTVYLGGVVRAPDLDRARETAGAAAAVLAAVPGVREVINRVEVAIGDTSAEAPPGAGAPNGDAVSGGASADAAAASVRAAAMSERLAVWRERGGTGA